VSAWRLERHCDGGRASRYASSAWRKAWPASRWCCYRSRDQESYVLGLSKGQEFLTSWPFLYALCSSSAPTVPHPLEVQVFGPLLRSSVIGVDPLLCPAEGLRSAFMKKITQAAALLALTATLSPGYAMADSGENPPGFGQPNQIAGHEGVTSAKGTSPLQSSSVRSLFAASVAVFYANGDYAHISNGQVSAHGWWGIVSGLPSSQKATVSITLRGRSAGDLMKLVTSPRTKESVGVYGPNTGGTGRRVTAKYTCKNFIQKSYWYSAITVDLVGRPDTTPTATTRTQTLYCGV